MDIKEILIWDWHCLCQHTLCEGNFCADKLSKMGYELDVEFEVYYEPPTQVLDAFQTDSWVKLQKENVDWSSNIVSEFKASKGSSSKEEKGIKLEQRKSTGKQSGPSPAQAPGLSAQFDGKFNSSSLDVGFEERLEAIRRAALEQKRAEEQKEFGPIDYDAPVESDKKTIGLGTKVGVGVAVVVFGLVFALGDFLPSGSVNTPEEAAVIDKKLSDEEKAILQTRLKQFEATLSTSPKDPTALEGAAVMLTELGDYARAASLLQDLAKVKTTDPDVFRLLGDVKYELKDYDGSAAAYKLSSMAVQFLLSSRERLNTERLSPNLKADGEKMEAEPEKVDPIQVDLLLGKAYSDWGHVSDAVAVYDQLISSHPNDFRGYLAKGIILKENGNVGDAERMFIQARFFAPEKAKALVDRFARQ
ncbi:Tetratricopeptide-like helical [Corchorus olitorius]|uniref:Tetratricopeptide-like helical n=1 Tax=Corchorus olitorius TaxID=93759 RepID=A0A1R3H5D1_9ROSI|nr:Tetratricopeptide-like helical [Corchorus olitorius]